MVERIERVTRVNGTDNDMARTFDRKNGYDDSQGRKSFADVLKETMRRGSLPSERGMPAAYALDISTRATQSLFYQNAVDVSNVTARLQIA